MPTIQDQLIGVHPVAPHIYGLWLTHTDTPATDRKKLRQLEEDATVRSQAIEQLAQWIVEYHVTDYNKGVINKARALLDKHGLGSFVDTLHVLPHSENTQKGNLGEIMLIEYVKASRGFTPLIYKLHYNPNVEQSMKGDDALLFDDTNIR